MSKIHKNGFAPFRFLTPFPHRPSRRPGYQWFRENIYKLEEEPSFDPKDKMAAWNRLAKDGKIPIGLIFQEEKASYESLVLASEDRPIVFEDLKINIPNVGKILEEFE